MSGIFDPAIFDGTTGGLIFDDGSTTPPAIPPTINQTLTVQLAGTELRTDLATITLFVDVESS